MSKITTIGLDLAKHVFHVVCCDERGKLVNKRMLKRRQVLTFFADLQPCRIGMEACAGAHYWARQLEALGHEVKLIPAQYVKAYVRGNKNDYNDALAISEAAGRPNMRFVTVKPIEQQDLQGLHRIRQSVVKHRTALANQIRGLLGEYGIVVAQGIGQVRSRIPEILEDGENGLTDRVRGWLAELLEAFCALDERIQQYDQEIAREHAANAACKRLSAIPGVGPKSATAIVATYGDGKQFSDGRQFSASIGLVPRQHTTGDKPLLLGISKRGDKYIRTLLIHGARSVIYRIEGKTDSLSRWLQSLVARRGKNKAAVALARRRRVPVTVDSRFDLLRHRGMTAVTPNEPEVEAALGVTIGHDRAKLDSAGRTLLERLDCQAVLITRGSHGMALFEKGRPTLHIPIHGTDQVADVTGAGDTVIATFTLALAAGASPREASLRANYAGGIVVMKHATATVSSGELLAAIREDTAR